jgi:hypothetical protein
MKCRASSSFQTSLWMLCAGITLGLAGLSGCGGTSTASVGKASSVVLESARKSLRQGTKTKGKSLNARSNLSVRERRALRQAGELPAGM